MHFPTIMCAITWRRDLRATARRNVFDCFLRVIIMLSQNPWSFPKDIKLLIFWAFSTRGSSYHRGILCCQRLSILCGLFLSQSNESTVAVDSSDKNGQIYTFIHFFFTMIFSLVLIMNMTITTSVSAKLSEVFSLPKIRPAKVLKCSSQVGRSF